MWLSLLKLQDREAPREPFVTGPSLRHPSHNLLSKPGLSQICCKHRRTCPVTVKQVPGILPCSPAGCDSMQMQLFLQQSRPLCDW